MKAVGGSAVTVLSRGKLERVRANAERWGFAGAGGVGRPIIAGRISAVGQFDQQEGARGISNHAVLESMGIPIWQRASHGTTQVIVDSYAINRRRERRSGGFKKRIGSSPIHCGKPALGIRSPGY